ncbi:Uncharacterized protein GBIM_17774 [Gryllus bimaculatus]|nr:Uncharacterized protein GBIM_17774 [Gryllus bimaculatus]
MEMLSTLNALAGKISPQSGTDSNANKVSIQNNNNNNNTSPHPHPYSKPAPPVPASSASASPASNAYGDSKLPPANGACSSPEILFGCQQGNRTSRRRTGADFGDMAGTPLSFRENDFLFGGKYG